MGPGKIEWLALLSFDFIQLCGENRKLGATDMKIPLLFVISVLIIGGIYRPASAAEALASSNVKTPRQSPGKVQKKTTRTRVAEPPRDAPVEVARTASRDELDSSTRRQLREIVVTAQKRSQPAFDVPISMTVIGGPEVQRTEITSLDSLQALVPGLVVEAPQTTRRIDIRGVSNDFGQGALVGMYLDEADVTLGSSNSLDLDIYDLARVEVLKGPQGTLYGEGSMGGTVRFITNQPNLNRFQMSADVSALFDQYGAPSQRTVAMLNVPLVQDELGLRIAGDFDHEGGWVNQPAANLKNINSGNLTDVRFEGLWEPFADFKVLATQVIHRNAYVPSFGENASGDFTQTLNLLTTPTTQDNFNLSNITASWDLPSVRLVNTATYLTRDLNIKDYGLLFPILAPPKPPFEEYYSPREQNEDWSDELRLSRSSQGPWQWTVGGFYRHYNDYFPRITYYYGLLGPPGSPLPAQYPFYQTSRSNSRSAFADTSYTIMGRLTVGAGVRSFKDDEAFLGTGATQFQTQSFTSVDPRFYLRYLVSEDVNVYASAAKGFRSGGFNALGRPPYGPETAWTYELGTKMRFRDEGVGADADVFVTNYSGYQIVGILPPPALPVSITRNAGTARIKGVEGDVAWSPRDNWILSLNGAYIDARFIEISVLDSPYLVGDPLDLTSRYSISASAQRDFTWYGRNGFARLDYSQRAPDSYRNRAIGPWYYSQSDYIYMMNFESGIQWRENLKFGFFVQNILNDRGETSSGAIQNYQTRARPRTFGLNFGVSFE